MMSRIEVRFGDDCGFVYVGDTRLIFSPQPDGSVGLAATRWGRPPHREWQEAREALQRALPDRQISP